MIRGVLAIAVLAGAAAAQQSALERYKQELEAGIQKYLEEAYDDAVRHFANARAVGATDWRGHTWQAFARLQQARGEKDPRRRNNLIDEAETMIGMLAKHAGLRFGDPLVKFLGGMVANMRGDNPRGYALLHQARSATPAAVAPYASIELKRRADVAFAMTSATIGRSLITLGQYSEADPLVQEAFEILKPMEDQELAVRDLHRDLAVLDESLGRNARAIEHLRAAIEMFEDDEQVRHELRSSIAAILIQSEKLEEGKEELARIPADSANPEVLAVRCLARLRETERDPTPERLAKTLQYYRDVMASYPKEDVYRLVEDYARLLLDNTPAAEVESRRPVLEDAIERLHRERVLRPECPSLYFLLSRIYKILGDEKKALEFQRLHDRKKREYENKERFDERGRPRCQGGS